ncbi:MAG: hypothetical protein Q8Q04_00010 [archaeon]|nr:hypothetical protein [archaeon]
MIYGGVKKKGQITIFVIIAIVIIALGASYFAFKDTLFPKEISSTFEPVETEFLNCLQSKTQTGIKLLETQGGYITPPPFVPGSSYMPFSSELDFFGARVPYWYTVSGNNIPLNQVPSKEKMEEEISTYLEGQIESCNFNSFTGEGYTVIKGVPSAEVSIKNNLVRVFLDMDLSVKKGDETTLITNHETQVDSKLGILYEEAVKFYNIEKKEMFLENYSIDFLRRYAPVDGFELSCSPKIWNANQIFGELRNATRDNFLAMQNSGSSEEYFNLNLPINSEVRIINFEDWPSTYEVEPADSPVLVANSVGNQEGLGILGFCYVPYHFVYDMKYPVLIQLMQDDETFQFPLPIIIENNVAIKRGSVTSASTSNTNLCEEGAKSNVTVSLVDSNSNPVEGIVSYECLGSVCEIGETKNGKIRGEFPECVNGIVSVKSEGYKEKKNEFSSVRDGEITVAMDKVYEKAISLNLINSKSNEKTIITFNRKDSKESYTLVYPENKKVNLSEGTYGIRVYTYDNGSLNFPATTIKQCVDVPSGIGGIFGITHEECSNINIAEQEITNVLVAGGKKEVYFSLSDLSKDNLLKIEVERYNNPVSLQELQIIYSLVEVKEVKVSLA